MDKTFYHVSILFDQIACAILGWPSNGANLFLIDMFVL